MGAVQLRRPIQLPVHRGFRGRLAPRRAAGVAPALRSGGPPVPAVADLIPDFAVTDPQTAGGLTVFGLRGPAPDPTDYATLDDALAAGLLDVTELTEGGSVPTLKLVNRGGPVFLMA